MSTITNLISQIRTRALEKKRSQNDNNMGGKSKHRSIDPRHFISAWVEDDNLTRTGPSINALVIILNTHGCSWARSGNTTNTVDSGSQNNNQISQTKPSGCSMCGYINDCPDSNVVINKEDIITQFRSALDKFKNRSFDLVKIFTSGSFLDDNELPNGSQQEILELCNKHSITNLLFESRPEFITHSSLEPLTTSFNGTLQIAIGLESANDLVLKHSINKGFTFNDYCTAVQTARELQVGVKTYLLLKPPFLSEQDAITDVINSIEILHSRKITDCISINPVNVQKFTLIEYLFHRNDYRPPWLWSVFDILSRGHQILEGSNIRLLSQPTAGGKALGAHNCGTCDTTVLKTINDYSLNNNISILEDLGQSCECNKLWKDVLVLEQITKNDPLIIPRKTC